MRIRSVSAYHIRIPFKATFSHALQSRGCTESIVIVVESECGLRGVGEVLPRPYLTGERIEDVWRTHLPALIARWMGRVLACREQTVAALRDEMRIAGRVLATLAGWELAVLDLAGQAFGFPAGDVLGPATGRDLEPGVVLDFAVPTASIEKRCILLRISGLRHIKVKVGCNDDLHRIEIVRGILGDVPLRLDANAAWTADHAIGMLRRMERFHVHSIEQPVPADDLYGMRRVRDETGVAVVADESVCSLDDARRTVSAGAADALNIRIGKCGGLLACQQLVSFARENGLSCHLGTLVGETGILSQAAEVFGRRMQEFEFLEGKRQNRTLLVEDIVDVPAPAGIRDREGLGLTIVQDRLRRWAVSQPAIFGTPQE